MISNNAIVYSKQPYCLAKIMALFGLNNRIVSSKQWYCLRLREGLMSLRVNLKSQKASYYLSKSLLKTKKLGINPENEKHLLHLQTHKRE